MYTTYLLASIYLVVSLIVLYWWYEIYKNSNHAKRNEVAATNWYACFKNGGDKQYLPLVFWVVDREGLTRARGAVLVAGGATGDIAFCDQIPGFCGYVYSLATPGTTAVPPHVATNIQI